MTKYNIFDLDYRCIYSILLFIISRYNYIIDKKILFHNGYTIFEIIYVVVICISYGFKV